MSKKVLGMGNALTDVLYQVSESDLRALNLPKGSMSLITMEQAQEIQERFAGVRMRMVAGGSACNTITTIASLGGKAAFIGKIGNMRVGDFYREDLSRIGVAPLMLKSADKMSGCSIVLITPDGERTFATYLGAAADLKPEDIGVEMIFTSSDAKGNLHIQEKCEFVLESFEGETARYCASILPERTGMYQVATRIYPKNPLLPHRQDCPYVKWL